MRVGARTLAGSERLQAAELRRLQLFTRQHQWISTGGKPCPSDLTPTSSWKKGASTNRRWRWLRGLSSLINSNGTPARRARNGRNTIFSTTPLLKWPLRYMGDFKRTPAWLSLRRWPAGKVFAVLVQRAPPQDPSQRNRNGNWYTQRLSPCKRLLINGKDVCVGFL